MTAIVTALYVPGDRPERFAKAVATGAQLVILDLEDAVAAERKDVARQNVVDWLRVGRRQATVRRGARQRRDPADLKHSPPRPTDFAVRLPKVESPADIDAALDALGDTSRLAALIETAGGCRGSRRHRRPSGRELAVARRGRPGQRPRQRRRWRSTGRGYACSSPRAPAGSRRR